MGWWFGRILTFEVEADEDGIAVAALLSEVSQGCVDLSAEGSILGYAGYGSNVRSAIAPLVESLGLEITDDGFRLTSPNEDVAETIGSGDLGCMADGQDADSLQRVRTARHLLPTTVAVTYYDPERDYQAGRQAAGTGEPGGSELVLDAPIVIGAVTAKGLAEDCLGRAWSRAEQLSVRLPPRFIGLRPGTKVQIEGDQRLWTVEECVIEGLAVRARLVAAGLPPSVVAADAGRASPSPDVVATPTSLALFDIPSFDGSPEPVVHVAAASASTGWRSVGVRLLDGDEEQVVASALSQSVLGYAQAPLPPGPDYLFDEINSLEVGLVDATDWLTSCTDEALLNGANAAVLGSEILQFATVTPLGGGRFRLSRLLRGRRGTEWAIGLHAAGEPFSLLQSNTVKRVPLSALSIGRAISAVAFGIADSGATPISLPYSGETCRPPSPVHLLATVWAGSLQLSWVRRSRYGWDWVDEVDAPLGESVELYRVQIAGTAGSLTIDVVESNVGIAAPQFAALGSGLATVTVRQVGDRALSRPATALVIIP